MLHYLHVLRFLFLVFLADFGKFGGIVNVAVSNVCLVVPPPDTLHPSARNLSLILYVERKLSL